MSNIPTNKALVKIVLLLNSLPWRRAWQPTLVLLPGESLWTEEHGELQSMGSQRVGHYWATKHSTSKTLKEYYPSVTKSYSK